MNTNLKEKGKKIYVPNKDVIELSELKAPNKGVHHDESDYLNHGLKILDSFVEKTNEIIKNMSLI